VTCRVFCTRFSVCVTAIKYCIIEFTCKVYLVYAFTVSYVIRQSETQIGRVHVPESAHISECFRMECRIDIINS
jgi:hypothetical protein